MKIVETHLTGVHIVEITKKEDSRGFFARTWDATFAKEHGLQERFDYSCISMNPAARTLRGMHWQHSPHGETKLVRCTRGAVFDVVLDVDPLSPTFKQWTARTLTAENHEALYVPPRFAHGFLTLEADTEILYLLAGDYAPEAADGARWNDPAFGIKWPAIPQVVSERDAAYPDFSL